MDIIQSYKYLKVLRMFQVIQVITEVGNGVYMHSITSPKMILYHIKNCL